MVVTLCSSGKSLCPDSSPIFFLHLHFPSFKMKQVAFRTISFLARHAQIPRESSVDPGWQEEAGNFSKGLSYPAPSDDEYILLSLKLRGIVSARDLRF